MLHANKSPRCRSLSGVFCMILLGASMTSEIFWIGHLLCQIFRFLLYWVNRHGLRCIGPIHATCLLKMPHIVVTNHAAY